MSGTEIPADKGPTEEEISRIRLEEAKLRLEERKLQLDETFPKKWGAAIFGVLGTVIVALISATVGYIQQSAQHEETKRAQQREETRRKIENTRNAIEMYFKYLPSMEHIERKTIHRMSLIRAIADDKGVQDVFDQMIQQLIASEMKLGPQALIKSPSQIAQGLPDRISKPPGHKYVAQDFIAYILYPAGNSSTAVMLSSALTAFSKIKVASMQARDDSPDWNQIRYYKPEHKEFAQSLRLIPKMMRNLLPGRFDYVLLANHAELPDGIIEIWIGKKEVE